MKKNREYKAADGRKRFLWFLIIVLAAALIFKAVDFGLSELTDLKAYKDAVPDGRWEEVYGKICSGGSLTDEEYGIVLSQTGLGRPALDKLAAGYDYRAIERYYEFYTRPKGFECIRKGVFACHERLTEPDGGYILNPPFADLQNGDIILTLSIHSLGWRHGHAAIVVDAAAGRTVEALMIGEKSCLGTTFQWRQYPLVAVLRARNATEELQNNIARFAADNMTGLDYSLTAGVIGGRNTEKTPIFTQCAHLVWFVYKAFGINVDFDGGPAITPYDILHSDELEIVQVYGNINEL